MQGYLAGQRDAMMGSMAELSRSRNLLGGMRVRILAAVIVLLAGSSVVSILLLRGALLERLDEEIEGNMHRETDEFRTAAERLLPPDRAPTEADLTAVYDAYFAREVPDEGETLISFIGPDIYITESAANAVPASELGDAIRFWLSLDEDTEDEIDTSGGTARFIALPLREGSTDGLFVIANFPAGEQQELTAAIGAQALIHFGTIVLASVVGWFLAGRVLRPLNTLADTARVISETDLTRRIPGRGDDEASRIATAFNDMLARLERAFATQRDFLDEVSHELRAPLTVIRGHVELLDLEDDPQERASTTLLITNEIDRMNRMVEDLLTLARAERPDFLTPEPVDLEMWTHDMFRKASMLCSRTWELEACASGVLWADSQRLTQAIMQLAENACQHTEATATVRIGSEVDGGFVRLWVHDDGPGVAAEDAERIFERFVRSSGRRTGSGLGLSIVAAIAEAHGGYARLNPHAGPGALFEIFISRNLVREHTKVSSTASALRVD
ncbi:HAMP domain-containing histidine kinase [Jiangella aurantiaca]|uniref:histidine kinase n=1 Tax=Jiangella aurantiaca TaxID=2530373 RepID=A0A4R5AAD9_9ACTN|nr:HAMP domain-containing sensor histidine kinase [Jiangella aurantiaca]TDD68625.1 HAMP domain-containing histidine kinase [Jiangella aurantiaca]